MVSMDAQPARREVTYKGADLKLYVRDVRDQFGRKQPITVRSWSTIKDVKDTIQKAIQIPAGSQRLYFGPVLTSGKELPNRRLLHDAGIHKSGETLLLDIKERTSGLSSVMAAYKLQAKSKNDVRVSKSVLHLTPRLLRKIVGKARSALALGLKPEFILEGSGGSYFLHDSRKVKIAVFKPADEEPYAEHNPRGYIPQAGHNMFLRDGVLPGEACIREVAAYLMDHGGFSGVPMTTLVDARHPSFSTNGLNLSVAEGGASLGAHSVLGSPSASLPKKVGSFQEFVRTECSMDDMSPSKLSADEVHKIAILDIRLMNADRNTANLLVRRKRDGSIELVPIDHGFCLRSVADVSWMDWCWLDWPQMKEPLSETTRKYIMNLDIEADARLLRDKLHICSESLDYFIAASRVLKHGVEEGLSLYDIAVMCCRNDNLGEVPSKLEVLFSMAAELADSAIANGRYHHAAASKALEQQLAPTGGSLLSPRPVKGFPRTMSALGLSHYGVTVTEVPDVPNKKDTLPGMVQSTASDSSSDVGVDDGEVEQEECNEWAAAVVADVSMDKSMSLIDSRPRSSSEDSSDSDSDSGGFWPPTARPGTISPDSSDEDSVGWSPPSSPNESLLVMSPSSFANDVRRPYNPFHATRRASLEMHSKEFYESFRELRSPGKASCADEPPAVPQGLEHPRTQHNTSDIPLDGLEQSRPFGKMTRSLSYTTLSLTLAEKMAAKEEAANTSRPRALDTQQYRDYFLKFIDMVIIRETATASRVVSS